MSRFDYDRSEKLYYDSDNSFRSLIMAAMRKADSKNLALLKIAWPQIWLELQTRYNAPGGILPTEAQSSTRSR